MGVSPSALFATAQQQSNLDKNVSKAVPPPSENFYNPSPHTLYDIIDIYLNAIQMHARNPCIHSYIIIYKNLYEYSINKCNYIHV